jgi:vacuolar iron transporter family protein
MHEHTHDLGKKKYVREAIFGFNDGLVSTFALVSGIAGAGFGNFLIAFIGIISALAGALSMGFGTYISTKSQIEVYSGEIKQELKRIEQKPKSSAQEIKNIFKGFGFRGKELEIVVKRITKNKAAWLSLIAHEEIGVSGSEFKNPIKASAIIFMIFIFGAMVPIIPYLLFTTGIALVTSMISGIAFLFIIGAVKTRITGKNWIKSGIEMTAVGLVAAVLVYYIGGIVGGYV